MENRFVVIVRVQADEIENPLGLPPFYPKECREYETREEAILKHPDSKVFNTDEYRGYQLALEALHVEATASTSDSKPWWKVW